jgi:hypothetical protein
MTDHRLFTSETPSIGAAEIIAPTITIQGDNGQYLVRIHPDGTLEYGPGYTPDEAAARFWDAVRRHARMAPLGGQR